MVRLLNALAYFNLIFCFSGQSPPIYRSVGRQENVYKSLTKVKIDKEAKLIHVASSSGLPKYICTVKHGDEANTRGDHMFYIFNSQGKTSGR